MVDPAHTAIRRDPRIQWICEAKQKHRELRGKTAAGKTSRGLGKGHRYSVTRGVESELEDSVATSVVQAALLHGLRCYLPSLRHLTSAVLCVASTTISLRISLIFSVEILHKKM